MKVVHKVKVLVSQNFGNFISKVVFKKQCYGKNFQSFLTFWFSKSFIFRLMFCTHAGTDINHPHLIQNGALNLRKCQVCTFHSVSPSLAPIAALF